MSVSSPEVAVNSVVKVTCHVSNRGNPGIHEYTWTKAGNSTFRHTQVDNVFSFVPVSVTDSGQYQCEASNTVCGSGKSSTVPITVRGI